MASNVVRKIDRARGDRIRAELERLGYEIREAPYAFWAAKGPGVSVTHYQKGKFLVQGAGAADFAAAFLDDPDELVAQNAKAPPTVRVTDPIIGTDESGKGDYFGPLVTAGFLVRAEDVPVLSTLGVRDSKDIKDREAREIAARLHEAYGDRIEVVSIGPERYNELHTDFGRNLNRLLAWCHAKAIVKLAERHDCRHALADRFAAERVLALQVEKAGLGIALEQRVRAEAHPAVAAASVLARARFLDELDRLGAGLGLKLRKGAGSPVDAVARQLFREGGLDRLRVVAKLHFRTTEKAQGRGR